MAMIMVITRAYYALGDVRTPLYLGLLSILVNVVVSMALMPVLAHSGLALANSLAAVFNALAMYVLLKRHFASPIYLGFGSFGSEVFKRVTFDGGHCWVSVQFTQHYSFPWCRIRSIAD